MENVSSHVKILIDFMSFSFTVSLTRVFQKMLIVVGANKPAQV